MLPQPWHSRAGGGAVHSIKPGLPPWGPHVRFRRVQTLVREGSPLVKLRNSASKVQSVDDTDAPWNAVSALRQLADVPSHRSGGSYVPILLQKSVEGFREQ